MPKNIIVANWKMNNDEYSSKKLTYEFLKLLAYKNNPKTIVTATTPIVDFILSLLFIQEILPNSDLIWFQDFF